MGARHTLLCSAAPCISAQLCWWGDGCSEGFFFGSVKSWEDPDHLLWILLPPVEKPKQTPAPPCSFDFGAFRRAYQDTRDTIPNPQGLYTGLTITPSCPPAHPAVINASMVLILSLSCCREKMGEGVQLLPSPLKFQTSIFK